MEEQLKKSNVIQLETDPWTKNMLELRPEREKKVKEDCAARKKKQEKGLSPIEHRNIWNHIKITTENA